MVADQVFALRDGFYCIVDGRTYGTWDTKAIAEAGMQVERRRADARKARTAMAFVRAAKDDDKIIRRGEFKIIRVDGSETMHEGRPTIRGIQQFIDAECLDTVILDFRLKQVMMVDDTGMCDGKPVNQKATALYHAICKPGTVHCIHGDVAIVNDGDFA